MDSFLDTIDGFEKKNGIHYQRHGASSSLYKNTVSTIVEGHIVC